MEHAMAAIPAIELHGVTKDYPGPVRALDSATFVVEEGERCCLLGPNGAGKTTIIRLLQGALQPTSGSLQTLGADAASPSFLETKRRTGVVPQNPGMYRDLTVREYLSFVRDLYGRGQVDRTIADCGLRDFAARQLSGLSGGYQRRVLVAAAIVSEPDLLLLDEPTVGLDPLAAADVRRLLCETMTGRTVLMSTHNLAEAEELCDSVIIVRHGRVLIHERIEDLRRQAAPRIHVAAHQGVEALAQAAQDMDLAWSPNGAGIWLQLSDPGREAPNVLRRLLSDGIDVFECHLVTPSLEDLFVEVVKRA
jgi:ABC-2 type transport system ATP-binding protein